MTVKAGTPPATAALPPIPLHHRLYGFGSIYGKTIRDSRLAFIIAAGVLGGMMLAAASAVSSFFPTPASRQEVDTIISSIPSSMSGLFGNPIDVGTLGGMMNWKYAPFFALGTSLWSILALSGTLAGEAQRGSLDIVASAPLGKRRVAIEKLTAHLTMLWLTMAIVGVLGWLGAAVWGDASLGDAIPPLSAFGFALWVGFIGLFFGGLAFALAPLLGKSGSAGVAGAALVVAWISNGYEALAPVAFFSPWKWTAGHAALVGQFDWPALALVGLLAVVFLLAGVEIFARRDLGVTAGLSAPGLPAATLGVRGPSDRSFGDQLPRALAWGIGLGLFGAMLASLVGALAGEIAETPDYKRLFDIMFPGYDVTTAGGFLQLYVNMLFIIAGYAGATLVAKWASDETEGRLEMLLGTPLARSRWVISGGIGAFVAVAVMTVGFIVGIGLGAASAGIDTGGATIGVTMLGLYAAAVVGVGVAIGGLWRTSLAAELAAVLVTATFLVDLLAPALKLPDWVHQLALTAHMGRPMIGEWNAVGMVACVALAVGGVIVGAWGIRRRDINT
jgi:ABC-2 type transport system permease protein